MYCSVYSAVIAVLVLMKLASVWLEPQFQMGKEMDRGLRPWQGRRDY